MPPSAPRGAVAGSPEPVGGSTELAQNPPACAPVRLGGLGCVDSLAACVIAQFDLLRRGAKLFGWTTDEKKSTTCWTKRES
jgi:hypothetical protein